jgi:hypothetical protein
MSLTQSLTQTETPQTASHPSAPAPRAGGFTAAVCLSPDPVSRATAAVIDRFNRAFHDRDPDAIAPLVAEDCVIEAITPAPDGRRLQGRAAALANWQGLARETHSHFDQEEVLVAGERAVIRWRYVFGPGAGEALRGVNIMRLRDGLIVEAQGYAKRPG